FLGVAWRLAEELTHVTVENAASPELCKWFLRGKATPWLGLVAANGTIKRTIEDELLPTIRDTQHRAVLITSAAGDGESSLMYRLAKQLFDEGWRVFFKHAERENSRLTWPLGRSDRSRTVLFVDRAEATFDPSSLPHWLEENPSLKIVMGARDMDWQQRG